MRFCSDLVLGMMLVESVLMAGARAESIFPEPADPPALSPRAVSVVRVDARTHRLVRTILVMTPEGKASPPGANPQVRAMVEEAAKSLDVSPLLVDSVIQVESNYNPYAISSKGAQGLMQLMPETARRFGVQNNFDPRQNIEGGVRYLKFLQDTFQNDQLAIAAYNAGEKAVAKYGSVPPYRETIGYVAKVGRKYSQAQRAAGPAVPRSQAVAPKAQTQQPIEDQTRHVIGYVDQEGRLHIATR